MDSIVQRIGTGLPAFVDKADLVRRQQNWRKAVQGVYDPHYEQALLLKTASCPVKVLALRKPIRFESLVSAGQQSSVTQFRWSVMV